MAQHSNRQNTARSPEKPTPLRSGDITKPLEILGAALVETQKPIIAQFKQLLAGMEGRRFETFEEADAAIEAIKLFAKLAGQKLLYDGQPVTLQCTRPARGTRASSIEVRKYVDRHCEYLHTGPMVPALSCKPAC